MSNFFLYLFIIIAIPLGTVIGKNLLKQRLKKSYETNKEKGEILYLRSFYRDGEGTEMSPSLFNPLAFIAKNQGNPHELGLASVLMNLGHLVAIGKPDEPIPEIGFERLYFSNDRWKEEVLKLMADSVLIIYRPDSSDNVFWEFDQILNLNLQSKVIIWNGVVFSLEVPLQMARYQIFRRKILALYNVTLPKYNRFKKFLSYDENGKWIHTNIIQNTHAYRNLLGTK
jgi:hypothetical protein